MHVPFAVTVGATQARRFRGRRARRHILADAKRRARRSLRRALKDGADVVRLTERELGWIPLR